MQAAIAHAATSDYMNGVINMASEMDKQIEK